MIVTILIFLIMLAVLILAHEFGHFAAAKLSGVKVLEFGLGFPPKILSFKRGDTIYSLNAVPLGGFTKMLGEEDPQFPGSLASKSVPIRIVVLGAGSAMNFILSVLLFALSYIIPHTAHLEKVLIEEVNAGSPAQMAGIEAGDTLLQVNGRDMKNRRDVSYSVQLNLGSEVKYLIQKPDGTKKDIWLTARWNPPPGEGATGIKIKGVDTTTITEAVPFWKAIPDSVVHCWEILVLFKNEAVSWFVRGTAPMFTGPIGIAQVTGEVAKSGFASLLEFTAIISINLAIINLLPFPGLDGGRLIFVFLEFIRRGRKVSPKKEGMVHLAGFLILITLIIIISYFDIIRMIEGGSLLP